MLEQCWELLTVLSSSRLGSALPGTYLSSDQPADREGDAGSMTQRS